MKAGNATMLNPRRGHKLYALAVLVALILVGYGLLIHPAFSVYEKNARQLDEAEFKYQKLIASSRQIEQLRKEIVALQARGVDRENFLENESPTIVMADLQKNIKSLVVKNGGHLLSMQSHDLENDEMLFSKVRASIDAVFDVKGLRDMLLEMSDVKPLLFIENISMQAAWHAGESGGQQAKHKVRVQMDVSGYMYTDLAQPAGPPG